MLSCPNKNDPRWKQMVDTLGENEAYYYFNLNEGFMSDAGMSEVTTDYLENQYVNEDTLVALKEKLLFTPDFSNLQTFTANYEVTFTENYNDYRGEYNPDVFRYYFNTKQEAESFFPDEYKERKLGEWPIPRAAYSKQIIQIQPVKMVKIPAGETVEFDEVSFGNPFDESDTYLPYNTLVQDYFETIKSKISELERLINNNKNFTYFESLKGEANKRHQEYELSKQAVEKWKAENNIVYNPEEVYSRGQEFVSVLGAYSNINVNELMKNLLSHITINKGLGAGFVISTFIKPADRKISHLENKKGLIKFKVYPKSEDILWASNIDAFSGSVWDAAEPFKVDSEFAGISYAKYPLLDRLENVQPNLANIIDNLRWQHNEAAIDLTLRNFRIEYANDVPQDTKEIIDSINTKLDGIGKINLPVISTNNPIKGRQVSSRPVVDSEEKAKIKFSIELTTDGQYLIISNKDNSVVDVADSRLAAAKSIRSFNAKKTPQEELNAKIVAHKKYNDLRKAYDIMSQNSDSDEKLYYSTVKEAIGNEIPLEVWKSLSPEEQTKIINCL